VYNAPNREVGQGIPLEWSKLIKTGVQSPDRLGPGILKEVSAMSGGTRALIGVAVGALLLLIVSSAFSVGPAWSPRDADGAGPRPMMGGWSAGPFDEDEPFDRQFVDRMVPHHAMAIYSARHMISGSPRPEMRELADDIVESQSEQIDQMRAWREEWYGDPGPEYAHGDDGGWSDGVGWDDNGMMGQGGGMMGRDGGMMNGDDADAMFLRMMIPHHEQAIQMSREALGEAEHPEIRRLAEQIITEQSAEIELMRCYLREME
jgi:uncharacterized protein (DUF305 family)